MRIIISPAKKMRMDSDSLPHSDLPPFLAEAEQIKQALCRLSPKQLQNLWKCNDSIAAQNIARLQDMNLQRHLTPAILSYEGIQYRYMAPGVFETDHFSYIQQHVRILSGFYGILRPFDGVTPYRLEMQAKLTLDKHKNLYAFWASKLAAFLAAETDLIVNLASREYSLAVLPYLPPSVRHLSCTFGEEKNGTIIEKGTLCKMARGQMVRWLAENQITAVSDLTSFTDLGYQYAAEHSTNDQLVFLRPQAQQAKDEPF